MLKNYLKIAWRNLARNKFYSAVTIAGLAIGLSVGAMILLWVRDEMSYDGFHSKVDQLYKINSHIGTGAGEQVWDGSPAPLTLFARQSIPEISNTVRIKSRESQLLLVYRDKKFTESNSAFVDPSFFALFDFPLLEGNADRPFTDDHSIVISASVARKFFGNEEALGRVLVNDKDNFTVTGVMKDIPDNSSIDYRVLFPMAYWAKQFTGQGGNGNWKTIDEDLGNYQYNTFVLLHKSASPEAVGMKISAAYKQHRPDEISTGSFTLQPLRTIHLVAADGNTGRLQTVRIFLLVAILILVIACINYVNLSTARSIVRQKEVSMRKIVGANKFQLFVQFITESVLLFVLASLLVFGIIYLLLPVYDQISGKQLVFSLANRQVWTLVGATIFGSLLLASIYPAVLLSSFKPMLALKGKLSSGLRNVFFRKTLVVIQFVFSVGLIIGTLVISSQLRYIREKDLGYDKEHVFSVGMSAGMHDHYDAVRNALLKQPGVLDVAASDNGIVGTMSSTGDTWWEGKEASRTFLIHPNGIDNHFVPMLKMQLVAGSNFTGGKSDSAHLILNETAVKQAGIRDPIGKTFTLWQTRATIIGVVKDFNYASLKQAIEPAAFYYAPAGWTLYIRTTAKDAEAAIAATKKAWGIYGSELPFSYSFLDDDFDRLYQADQRMGTLFNIFSAIAIFISCLGLFALATYTAQAKTKEIGIRKVLGASVAGIANSLAKEFLLLVILAFVIASPIAWFAMSKWLENFNYRVGISLWIFAITGLMSVAIAVLTVGFQAIRAALANPVESLRAE